MNAIIIQARMSSTRLPGKVLRILSGQPLLWHIIERCKRVKTVGAVAVATSTEVGDSDIAALAKRAAVPCYRGSHDDVLARYAGAARELGATTIVRITSDCPLVDPFVIDECIKAFEQSGADYVSNVYPERTFPRGLDVEVFSFAALEKAAAHATSQYDREHVTPYIWRNDAGAFRVGPAVIASNGYARSYRLCVDYPEDAVLMEKLYEQFYASGTVVDVPEVLSFLDIHQEIAAINIGCEQKS